MLYVDKINVFTLA